MMDQAYCAGGPRGRGRVGGTSGAARLHRAAHLPTVLGLVVLLAAGSDASAQVQMPDARQMSGVPLPTGDLPDRTVSVRVIRGQLSNNLPNHPVELRVNGEPRTVSTDEGGRAQFGDLPADATAQAATTVDGERVESQVFQVPAQGGIRVILVATDTGAGPAARPDAPPQAGIVNLAGESRVVVELGEEGLQVFYLFDFDNTAQVPIQPASTLVFDLPAGARRTTVLQASTAKATVSGSRVTVSGPFPPGRTSLELAYELPYSGTVALTQRLPTGLDRLAVIAQRAGALRLDSPNLTEQREMSAEGRPFVVASGPGIPAGGTFSLELTGVPHHGVAGRYSALALAIAVLGVGLWIALTPPPDAGEPRRRKLLARRDLLFGHLVKLEEQRHAGTIDPARYRARRSELMLQLERVYGALDESLAA